MEFSQSKVNKLENDVRKLQKDKKEDYQKERKPGIEESRNHRSRHQRSRNPSGHQGSGNQSGNQGSGNGVPRQDGNYNTNGRPDNRTFEERTKDKEGNRVNKVNKDLIKHFAPLLK